ncbi:Hypp5069 [Branchiostoma lanceolatum]|uniref:Hypp5069 protein n=1 Tax=Branchiostoma lanceolatum TaxID=7740 RepID=A0A8K0ADB2_BRALA|nr:Hypp5069 [Branchiostoma lanceolatum]
MRKSSLLQYFHLSQRAALVCCVFKMAEMNRDQEGTLQKFFINHTEITHVRSPHGNDPNLKAGLTKAAECWAMLQF